MKLRPSSSLVSPKLSLHSLPTIPGLVSFTQLNRIQCDTITISFSFWSGYRRSVDTASIRFTMPRPRIGSAWAALDGEQGRQGRFKRARVSPRCCATAIERSDGRQARRGTFGAVMRTVHPNSVVVCRMSRISGEGPAGVSMPW